MSTTIMIHREYDHDAIAAECPYFVEVTEAQAFAFATLVDRAKKGIFVSADEGCDVFVDSFGLSLLADQIDQIKAIFGSADVDVLLDQILRLDIRIGCTEAIGLGAGRYILTREVRPADNVKLRMTGGVFSHFWRELGFTQITDGETNCGQLSLDHVEEALNNREPTFFVPQLKRYAERLREVIAYGRQNGAAELYWA